MGGAIARVAPPRRGSASLGRGDLGGLLGRLGGGRVEGHTDGHAHDREARVARHGVRDDGSDVPLERVERVAEVLRDLGLVGLAAIRVGATAAGAGGRGRLDAERVAGGHEGVVETTGLVEQAHLGHEDRGERDARLLRESGEARDELSAVVAVGHEARLVGLVAMILELVVGAARVFEALLRLEVPVVGRDVAGDGLLDLIAGVADGDEGGERIREFTHHDDRLLRC